MSRLTSYIPSVAKKKPPSRHPGDEYYKGSSNTWGQVIPLSAGVRRMSSWIIWLQAYMTFIEGGTVIKINVDDSGTVTAKVETVGGKVFATFAVSFGYPIDHDADDSRLVRNIWANGRLLWSDAVGATSATALGGDDAFSWTFYPGSEDQPIDPLMDADHPGTTPAYRGQMIMVLDHFPCHEFEGKIPSITAEIIDGDSAERMVVSHQLALMASFSGVYTGADVLVDDALLDIENDGLLIEENWKIADFFNVVGRFYDWDYVESGGLVKFFRSVNAAEYTVAATITESEIVDDGSNQGEGTVLTTRADDSQIPIIMEVNYYDRSQQYQLSLQRARRQQFPQKTVLLGSSDNFAVPFITTASEALTGATRALYKGAHERLTHNFTLPPHYAYLEPGDILSLLAGGKTYIVKLTYLEMQQDLSLLCTATNVAYGADYTRPGFGGGIIPPVVDSGTGVYGWDNLSVVSAVEVS